ncbi:MAG: cell division protein FtsZ [Candidatus Methanomethylophilaceae archaeon]|nr:cell division protein FtsZ [Candidatus Methanomethylophilaceae archaeon]
MVYESANNKKVAIVGVGGAGCNVVSQFYKEQYGVDTIAINTDKDGLHAASAGKKIYICKEVLHGEGAYGETEIGKKCADIHIEEIREALSGYDVVFVVSGLGGGTGTGATPVVIEAAQSQNILTFAIAIKPFFFEGDRVAIAKEGYSKIRAVCPLATMIENDMIVSKLADKTMDDAFSEVNRTIKGHIEACISKYDDHNDDNVSYNDEGFDSFVKTSPLCAFISA